MRRRNTITSLASFGGSALTNLKQKASSGMQNYRERRGRGSIVGNDENPLNKSMTKGEGAKKRLGDFFKKKYLDLF
jgi:hypothetical protein